MSGRRSCEANTVAPNAAKPSMLPLRQYPNTFIPADSAARTPALLSPIITQSWASLGDRVGRLPSKRPDRGVEAYPALVAEALGGTRSYKVTTDGGRLLPILRRAPGSSMVSCRSRSTDMG